MKKLLLSLIAMTFAIGVNAQTVVEFDATTDLGSVTDYNNAGEDQITKDGVTIAITNGCLGLGTDYRTYKNATMTLSSAVGNITGIEFTCTANGTTKQGPGCWSASCGDYTYEGKVGTWSGSATEVTFSATENQVRATKIVVTIGGTVAALAKPKASKASGTYYETFAVELTAAEGADIYYQIDGEGYQKYSAPISIESSCILEAYAQKGEDKSEVATFDYVIELPTGMTLAEAITKENKTAVEINEEMVVVYKSGQYTYVNAGQAWGLIYGTTTYKAGDVIPAGFKGTISIYNNLVEIVPVDAPASSTTASVPMPTEVTDPSALALVDVNKYVVFKNAFVDVEAKTLSIEGKSVTLYKRFSECPLPETNDTFAEVLGFVSVYKEAIQVYPTEFNGGASRINEAIYTSQLVNQNNYNLAGQKVSEGFKGIVIVNGKKIVK